MQGPHSPAPILTLVAGPNGSGKTTIVTAGLVHAGSLGVLVNADNIATSLANRKGEPRPSVDTQWEAAKAAEEMRWSLLSQGISFATETVMSDGPRWQALVNEAKIQGYRVVLYFVTTSNPLINVRRVVERVRAGGHAVDPRKVVSRYRKVMDEVLPEILKYVDEAILFDNSSARRGAVGVLHFKEGKMMLLVAPPNLPHWAFALIVRFLGLDSARKLTNRIA